MYILVVFLGAAVLLAVSAIDAQANHRNATLESVGTCGKLQFSTTCKEQLNLYNEFEEPPESRKSDLVRSLLSKIMGGISREWFGGNFDGFSEFLEPSHASLFETDALDISYRIYLYSYPKPKALFVTRFEIPEW